MRNLQQPAFEFSSAHRESIFRFPTVRFTVLTSRMIRIEQSRSGEFEDRPSQVFWYRNQEPPEMQVEVHGKCLSIETSMIKLNYQDTGTGLTPETLSIVLKETGATYRYADPNPSILPGTTRTLDKTNGPVQLQPGYLSRSGWVVIDDTSSLVFTPQGWVQPRTTSPEDRDLYFLASGWDYQAALADFQKIAGKAPLMPRYMLGNWWSRFWEYSQDELLQLVHKFRENEIPLSVLVIDMDWHMTKTGNGCTGWTGFSWNKELFPDPGALLAWLHQQGLHVSLNLHPAEGIYPHEDRYHEVALSLGLDPGLEEEIPFNISDPGFSQAYFECLLHPLEQQGVDFWWLDWQQGNSTQIPDLDPLWWLNHLHYYDLGRDGTKRPVIFSRWGGPGSHRYPIGFSGDTIISWESLAFQPYFTATSANAAYGWWSHDIGGHMHGTEDGELYVRWLQFGVLSPILRIHSTKDISIDHQPWAFGVEVLRLAKDALQIRHRLIPYLYTMARRNEQEGLPLVTPLYYEWPKEETAYLCPNEYLFGSELLAAPITSPMHPDLKLSRHRLWFPPGDWFDFFSGTCLPGPAWKLQYRRLDEIPLYAKAGAIVPLQPRAGWGGIENPAELDLLVFPGKDGEFTLYEDDGLTQEYLEGKYFTTKYHSRWADDLFTFTVDPIAGNLSQAPRQRIYNILFRGITNPRSCSAVLDGHTIETKRVYDPETHTCTVGPVMVGSRQKLAVEIDLAGQVN
jgi:alpha-glucosidase (family GH31 glycosyl hydrolase)